MNLFSSNFLGRCEAMLSELKAMDEETRIEAINALRLEIHKVSPMASEPVDCVVWVKADEIQANDYNPNSVAPPEMKLLAHSIEEDGYTQPIVAWKNGEKFEVVDGYHRNRVGREVPKIRARIRGYLPITVVNSIRTDRSDRIAATIRHNRARGKHRIDAMSDIVVELKRRNWSDEKIGRELGMDPDEVLRLTQITGLAEMFADRSFSQAWESQEAEEINPQDRLDTNEENLSPLPHMGGLEGRNVSGNPIQSSSNGDRCGSAASKNAVTPEAGDVQGNAHMANGNGNEPVESGAKPEGVARTVGLLFNSDGSGLPHETSVAHPKSKPAGRSKRRGRFSD